MRNEEGVHPLPDGRGSLFSDRDELFVEEFFGGFGDIFGGESEVLVDCFVGSGGAEAVESYEEAVGAKPFVPALADAGFDGDAGGDVRGQDLVLILFGLLFKKLPAGHGDQLGGDAILF